MLQLVLLRSLMLLLQKPSEYFCFRLFNALCSFPFIYRYLFIDTALDTGNIVVSKTVEHKRAPIKQPQPSVVNATLEESQGTLSGPEG